MPADLPVLVGPLQPDGVPSSAAIYPARRAGDWLGNRKLLCGSPFNFGPRLVLACAHLTNTLRWPNRCGDFKAVVPGPERLLEARRAALALPERLKRGAEVVLRRDR